MLYANGYDQLLQNYLNVTLVNLKTLKILCPWCNQFFCISKSYMSKVNISQNHRMAWLGRDLKAHLSQPLPWAGLMPTSSGCPGPHPTWPWAPPGMWMLPKQKSRTFFLQSSNLSWCYSSPELNGGVVISLCLLITRKLNSTGIRKSIVRICYHRNCG